MADTVPFLDKVPNYEIRDGIMHISSGDWAVCMPLRNFRLSMAKATDVLRAYDDGRVVSFPRKRRRKDEA